MGACPPPLRGRSAVLSPNAAMYLFGQTIELHIDFDLTGAWRHHVSMRPSSRSQSAATTALTAGIGELFRVKRLREIPQWWILGRCGPPNHSFTDWQQISLRLVCMYHVLGMSCKSDSCGNPTCACAYDSALAAHTSQLTSGPARGPPEAPCAAPQCGNGAPAPLVSASTDLSIKYG